MNISKDIYQIKNFKFSLGCSLAIVLVVLLLSSQSHSAAMSCGEFGFYETAEMIKKRNPWIQKRINNLTSEIRELEIAYPGRVVVTSYGSTFGTDLIKIELRAAKKSIAKAVIASGLHGNESLGPLTGFEAARSYLKSSEFSDSIDLTIYPMVNPEGLAEGLRRARKSVDLNRNVTRESLEPEIAALVKDFENQNFDLALDLHGGPTKDKFFVIRYADDFGLAAQVLASLPQDLLLPSNTGTYPGRSGIPKDPERYEMNSLGVASSNLPGTLKSYLASEVKVPYSYSIEYPGRLDPVQALALNTKIVHQFLHLILQRKANP